MYDAPRGVLADHRRLHAVVEQLARCAAEGFERRHMAAQHRRQILVHHEPCPDQPAVAQHHGEQPYDPWSGRLAGEHHLEAGEVDLAQINLDPSRGPADEGWTAPDDRPHLPDTTG